MAKSFNKFFRMSFWDSYGPTLAKQVELISNLTLKNNDLEARLTALSGELQKSNADLKEAQESCALLSEQNQHLLQLVEEERARAEQSWRSHLTLDQFVTKEQYADVIKERDDLIKQNQILTDQLRNAETESEEEPATVGRRRGRTSSKNSLRKPHPNGDKCRVPNCGVTTAHNWRPSNYENPEYGKLICDACSLRRRRALRKERYERERAESVKQKQLRPHPQGGCCLVDDCGAKSSTMWRKNNTGNPAYGEVICNECWRSRRK